MDRRTFLIGALLAGAPIAQAACAAQQRPNQGAFGITAVEGLELGHHTLSERPTGCTVILARAGAVGGVDVRGSAPGTREIALLDPVNTVERVNAIVLAGGAAFGLSTADGVMRYLDERDIGYRVGNKVVPIVAGAILYDLGLEGDAKIRPGPECGYAAAAAASSADATEGSVGAGAGATVGKMRGPTQSMRGGFGTASITLASGLTVAAAVAVNAVGDIVDPATGRIVAGARTPDGTGFVDMRRVLREAGTNPEAEAGANTTIGVVATNATLTKSQTTKIAQMAQDGLARAIYPAHTAGDGDTVFSLATGAWTGEASVTVIGALAADVMAEAILRAVRMAQGLPGIPSVSDLGNE
ncbi:MAG: P1 family peptidase [Gemmatimonadetes bacterium]|nr:P1 family peptidase [Gemmatimonadota bacterium]MDA1102909.1 P1 family peptidase [Gemmatimonadota bacterium]